MAISAKSRTVSFFHVSPLAAIPRLVCGEAKHQGLSKSTLSIAQL